jgi:hypothetical protein
LALSLCGESTPMESRSNLVLVLLETEGDIYPHSHLRHHMNQEFWCLLSETTNIPASNLYLFWGTPANKTASPFCMLEPNIQVLLPWPWLQYSFGLILYLCDKSLKVLASSSISSEMPLLDLIQKKLKE